MIWLGTQRGYLTDWITQRWVQLTGRRVALNRFPWLAGPSAPTTGISEKYFEALAHEQNLQLNESRKVAGIISDFARLRGGSFDPASIDQHVVRFYEKTSLYELDAWAEWCGFFRPFGWLLAVLFSRRLQQLNIPLSSLDTSRGMSSEVFQLVDPDTGEAAQTIWFRRLLGTGNVLYAGFYSVCQLPGHENPCVKVVFPLPNGNAIVIMRTERKPDGSFVITSAGRRFGDHGFYFTVAATRGVVWARYVAAMRESIHVLPAENETVRADHVLTLFGARFLRLHYRMRPRAN